MSIFGENSFKNLVLLPIPEDSFDASVAPKPLRYRGTKPEYIDSSGSDKDVVTSRRQLPVLPSIICNPSTSTSSSSSFDAHSSDSTYVPLVPFVDCWSWQPSHKRGGELGDLKL